jgi:hypothetical protein
MMLGIFGCRMAIYVVSLTTEKYRHLPAPQERLKTPIEGLAKPCSPPRAVNRV